MIAQAPGLCYQPHGLMNAITPHDLPTFLRRYRLTGGRIRRVRVLYPRPKEVAVEFHVTAQEAAKTAGTEPQKVRLMLRLEGAKNSDFRCGRTSRRRGSPTRASAI